jgi:ubiquinone/menaquinone biosynthesis C-methylase UbiE
VENSAAYLISHLRPGLTLLDVGCGPGTITADFAAKLSPGRVLGIDAAADVISAAKTAYPEVAFATGDVYQLEKADGSWDIVHAHQVLQHLADPVAALKAMRRAARSGGIVAARDSDYASFTWHPADERLTRWLALYREIARTNGGEPEAGRYSCHGRSRRASPTSRHQHQPGASQHLRSAAGGAGSGPIV